MISHSPNVHSFHRRNRRERRKFTGSHVFLRRVANGVDMVETA